MPTPNADDPLRTTDHAPAPVPETAPETVTTDAPLAPEMGKALPSLADKATVTFQPTQDPAADGSSTPTAEPPLPFISGYEIEGVLGRGGMGVVYKARHLALKRTVALKMILAGGHAGPQELARFRIEAEAVARLQHPNIVQVFEVGEAEGHPYCALEFIEGGNLAGKIGGKPLPARESARLVEALARAVQLAHSRNVVHRDLKPANVLLASDGTPKITDFGLARQTDSDSGETQAGAIVGTPSYMAPEQASGRAHEAGVAADVYALGAILYDCLAGRPPFKAQTVVETLDQVRTQEPVPPSRWQKTVPPDLETICLKCLRKEPERRYASAAELADDLVRYQHGEPIRARPVGRVERAGKWVRRNPVPTAAALAVVLALVVGATVGYLNYREAQWNAAEARMQTGRANTAREEEEKRADGEKRERLRANDATDDAYRKLDNSAVLLATAAFDNRNAALARLQLHTIAPKRRGWEWHYLRHQFTGGIFTLYGHTSAVKCVAVSPDGTRIATGAQDGKAFVWDAATGACLLEVHGNKSPVLSLAFSPDGTRFVTGGGTFGGRGELKVWDTRTGTLLLEITAQKWGVNAVAFSPGGGRGPDGSRIVAGGQRDPVATVWDAKTGKPLLELKQPQPQQSPGVMGEKRGVMSVAFSPDGDRIVTGTFCNSFRRPEQLAIVWDAKTGKALAELSGNRDEVTSVAFSPDGSRVVTGCAPLSFMSNTSYVAKVYDAMTGKHQFDLKGHTSYVNSVAFSPDGSRIVTGSWDKTARVWDAKTGVSQLELKGHADIVTGVAFSPDGERIVTGSDDRTAKVWDARTGTPQVVELKGQRGTVSCVAFSSDGSRIVTGSCDNLNVQNMEQTLPGIFHNAGEGKGEKTVTVWECRTGRSLLDLPGHAELVCSAAFSPDGSRIVTGSYDRTAKIWNAQTGKLMHDLKGHTERVWSVAFSPDNARVATCSEDKKAFVWDAETGKVVLELKGHTAPVTGVAFSPDGSRIVTSSADKTARVWDAHTGNLKLELRGHASYVTCVAFSGDSKRILTGGGDGDATVKVWDAETGALQLDLKGHGSGVLSVAFNRDGTRILTGSQDRTAKVWDSQTGIALLDLKGHGEAVAGVAFSPDGTQIALTLASIQANAKVWNARIGMPSLELSGHTSEVKCVAFSPDGTRVVTGSVDRTARVWDTKTGKSILELKGHTEAVLSVAFSPDGTQIATGSADRTARVWDARTGALLLEFKGDDPPSTKEDVPMMIPKPGEPQPEPKKHETAVIRVAFSLDGKQLVTSSASEMPLVYDGRAGMRAISGMALMGSNGGIHWEPGPEGMRIWQTHHFGDQSTVWDARTGKELKDAPIPKTVPSNRISPDGRFFAHMDGNHVEFMPLQPDEQELAYRRSNTQPNLERYREGYREARTAKEDFTARFYLHLLPPPESAALEARAALVGAASRAAPVRLGSPDLPDGGKKDEAIALYRKAVELDANNAGLRITLGALLSDKGQKDEALALYLKAIELDPKLTLPLSEALKSKGQVNEALACYRKSVELDPKNAAVHVVLGDVLADMSRTDEAVACYLKASELDPKDTVLSLKMAALQAWFGRDKELAATRQRILASVKDTTDGGLAERVAKACSIRPSTDKAELEAALALGRTAVTFGGDPKGNRVALGMAEYRSGNYAAAEKALTVAGQMDPNNTHATGIAAYYQAMCLFRQGKKDEARKVGTEATAKMRPLPTDEKNPLAGGGRSDDLILWLAYKEAKALIQFEEDSIASLTSRAAAYLRAGKPALAVPLLFEIVKGKKSRLGPDNPDTLNSMDQLGVVCWQAGQFDKSVPVFEEVSKRREALLGREHPETLNALANLGTSYKDAGQLKEALPLLEEAHQAAKKYAALGWVGGQLLDAYAKAGESTKFAALLQEQLAEARNRLPGESPQLAGLLAQFSMALLQQKKWAEAEPLLRESLAIREKTQPDQWNTFNARSMLGGALLGQKKYADAEPLLLKGHEGMKAREKTIPPPGMVRIPEALDRLIELYTATNKPDEAKKWRAERAKYPEPRAPEKK